MDDAWLASLAASPWLLPMLFALVVGDAFLVVLPSETLVVALGALAATTGSPALWQVVPVAAAGAVVGDGLCYLIGRRVGLDRWRWQRADRIAAATERMRTAVHRRTALLVFTARYVPFARIAVNLAAGAGRVPLQRYLPLSAAAGIAWASYNVAIGAVVGSLLRDSPLVAIGVSVPIAITLGLVVDHAIRALDARRVRIGADRGEH
ncbi:membrane protein DedA with SNARE-associated domain [Agromyces cerinus]|uniref:DedA family protein n=1 Tax=Agromyces cerinus TaxID=33878 RepID=UPI0027DB9A3A|nr:VTT domain-containing protein [Agromyces cerinus]MBM7831002.1 membrane protein DedA with SNARE-associated domain [Agromyces cerinus]